MAFDPLFLPAGSLRHAITIKSESLTGQQDEAGQPLDSSWTSVLTTRASIDVAKQSETYQSGMGFTSQVTHVVKLRWTPLSIAPGMRVYFGSKVFQVQTVENVQGRNRVIKLQVLALNEEANNG
jgi:head-tail adaptor